MIEKKSEAEEAQRRATKSAIAEAARKAAEGINQWNKIIAGDASDLTEEEIRQWLHLLQIFKEWGEE